MNTAMCSVHQQASIEEGVQNIRVTMGKQYTELVEHQPQVCECRIGSVPKSRTVACHEGRNGNGKGALRPAWRRQRAVRHAVSGKRRR